MRLDKYVAQKYSLFSRQAIQRAIALGKITVNGAKTKKSYPVRSTDVVKVSIPSETFSRELRALVWPANLPVVHEEKDFAVINKPAGLAMHPPLTEGVEVNQKPTLAHYLISRYPKIKSVGDNPLRPGIVHRLDKDVSGLVVVARTAVMFAHLKTQFQKRLVDKWYLATVAGRLDKSRVIKTKIARHPRTLLRRVVSQTGGVEAVTEVYPLKPGDQYSVVKVRILTGRMHQIRVHLKHIGHPIVGDKIYRGAVEYSPDLQLRAIKLSFQGTDGRTRTFVLPGLTI